MSTLEQDIIEKFQQLQSDAKHRVLRILSDSVESSFDYATWWEDVDTLQADIRTRLGETQKVGALSLLDELREETP